VQHQDGLFEIISDEHCAPRRWTAAPHEAISIRFGVAKQQTPAAAAIRFTSRHKNIIDGANEIVAAEPDAAITPDGVDGYQLFRAELPALDQAGCYHYQIGYTGQDGRWCWSPTTRTVIVTAAPRRFDNIDQHFLGWHNGRQVSGPVPVQKMTPVPDDWRRRLFYSLMLDRFAIAAPQRQGQGFVRFNPDCALSAHGGDLAGLHARLDYLQELGVGALILSPLYINAADGYHGYHALHLLGVDPRYGTLEDVRALVRAAHQRNILVLFDVLVNHIADVVSWQQTDAGLHGRFRFDLEAQASPPPLPVELSDPGFFHSPDCEGLIEAPLFGFLEDWRTEHSFVRKHLITHLKYWISTTDVDGFRFDAVRHVELDFWQQCLRELRDYCQVIGKPNFFLLGEHAGHLSQDVGVYSRDAGFSGMIDYPLYYRLRAVFAEATASPASLADYLDYEVFAYRDSRYNLAFLDNHDTTRFRHHAEDHTADEETAYRRHLCALAWLILGPQLPCIYYGTEQEFNGAHVVRPDRDGKPIAYDCHVREDMFVNAGCLGPAGPLNRPRHPPYDRSNRTFQTIRRLAALRAAQPALWQGDRYGITADHGWLVSYLMWTEAGGGSLMLIMINFAEQTIQLGWDLNHIAPALSLTGRDRLLRAGSYKILFQEGDLQIDKTGEFRLYGSIGPHSAAVIQLQTA
jgi:glycosidase